MRSRKQTVFVQLVVAAVCVVACAAAGARAQGAAQGFDSAPTAERAIVREPRQVLSTARVLYVQSETEFLTSSKMEQALQSKKEFDELGLALTRSRDDADLIIEVHRSAFTTHFDYQIIDPDSRRILSSGDANSLFGTASGKIASQIVKKLSSARRLSRP